MKYNLKVNDSTYYFGQNDRIIERFEHLYPVPNGMAYNNYLIKDEKNVLLDTVDVNFSEQFFDQLESALEGENLDYLIVQHMEPDHSGAIRLLRNKYPNVQIVANKKTAAMLKGYHQISEGIVEVGEGSELNIGSRSLEFILAPMVHWPEVMFTYDPLEKVLFSADAFGAFGAVDGGFFDEEQDLEITLREAQRYYTNIVGKYGSFTLKALEKASKKEIKTICPVHGPVWRKHIPEVMELYQKMASYEAEEGVVIVFGSMYGHTEQLVELIGRSIAAHGVKNVKLHHMGKSSSSYVVSDVFRYKGVIWASPTYNNSVWPNIQEALEAVASRNIPNRLYAVVGSGSWNPITTKPIEEICEKMKWTQVAEPIKMLMNMDGDIMDKAWEIGRLMAEAVKQ